MQAVKRQSGSTCSVGALGAMQLGPEYVKLKSPRAAASRSMRTTQLLCDAAQVEVGFKLEDQRGPASEWIALDSVQVRRPPSPHLCDFVEATWATASMPAQIKSPDAGGNCHGWIGEALPPHLGDCGVYVGGMQVQWACCGISSRRLDFSMCSIQEFALVGVCRFCLRACLHLLSRVCAQRAISKRFRTFLLSFAVEKDGARHYRDAIRDMCRGRPERQGASLFWTR